MWRIACGAKLEYAPCNALCVGDAAVAGSRLRCLCHMLCLRGRQVAAAACGPLHGERKPDALGRILC